MTETKSTPTVGRWESARVKMAMDDGPCVAEEAFVHPDAAGLAVTRCHVECHSWSVTHIASGRGIGGSNRALRIGSREEAERFALALGPLTDWTRGFGEVMADKPTLAPKVKAARRELFGASTWDAEDESDGD